MGWAVVEAEALAEGGEFGCGADAGTVGEGDFAVSAAGAGGGGVFSHVLGGCG